MYYDAVLIKVGTSKIAAQAWNSWNMCLAAQLCVRHLDMGSKQL